MYTVSILFCFVASNSSYYVFRPRGLPPLASGPQEYSKISPRSTTHNDLCKILAIPDKAYVIRIVAHNLRPSDGYMSSSRGKVVLIHVK